VGQLVRHRGCQCAERRRETSVKGNDGGEWSSNDIVLWLGRRQHGDVVE
jgi:hypothetical protein